MAEPVYRDKDLQPGRYYYKIEAVAKEGDAVYQNSGQSAASTGVSITEVQIVKEKLPAPAVTATVTENTVTLTWTAVEHAVSYEVYRAASENEAYSKLDLVKETTYQDGNLENGTYYYKVIAKPEDDSEWEDSAYSDTASAVVAKKTEDGDSTEQKPGGETGGSTEQEPGGETGGSTEQEPQKVSVTKIELPSTVNVAKAVKQP